MLTKEIRQTIKKHCQNNNLEYRKIITRIEYQINKKNILKEITLEQLINNTVTKYKYKQWINNIDYNINLLQTANTNKEFRTICKNLNINWPHILKLSYKGYDKKQTILYFWYFYDQIKNNKKDLSRKRLYEIKEENNLISNNFYYLISYYKCGKKEYLEKILAYEEHYLKKIIYSISQKFNLSKSEKDDLKSEAQLILIQIIEKITLNDIGQIINYIKLILFGRLFDYTKKNYEKRIEFNETYMYNKENLEDAIQFNI